MPSASNATSAARPEFTAANAVPLSDPWGLVTTHQHHPEHSPLSIASYGKDGKGADPMAKALKVGPPDLTRIAKRNVTAASFRWREFSGSSRVTNHCQRDMARERCECGDLFIDKSLGTGNLGGVRVDNLPRYIEGIRTKQSGRLLYRRFQSLARLRPQRRLHWQSAQ